MTDWFHTLWFGRTPTLEREDPAPRWRDLPRDPDDPSSWDRRSEGLSPATFSLYSGL